MEGIRSIKSWIALKIAKNHALIFDIPDIAFRQKKTHAALDDVQNLLEDLHFFMTARI